MSNPDATEPSSPLLVLPNLTPLETSALDALGLAAGDYAALLAPCQQMGVGFAQDPATGRPVLVLQAVVAMDAGAINLRPSGLLDASGQRGVAGGDMRAIIPVGGSLRLVVRRDALADKLRERVESDAPRPFLAFASPADDSHQQER
jgi:hypothetical protein